MTGRQLMLTTTETVGLLSLADGLGIDPNALVDALDRAGRPAAIPALLEAQKAVDGLLVYTVKSLRAQGYSWTAIARYLGVSKQAAAKRYGPLCD